MKKLIDYIMPNNCRKELYAAAVKNKAVCEGVVYMIKQNHEKVLKEVSTPTRKKRPPFACR